MRRGALLFPALGALVLLPALNARADVASCRDELQRLAQTYHLSVSPPAQTAAQPSPGATAEAPATTESRGVAGPDSLESSGGTLPPSTDSASPERRSNSSSAQHLGGDLAKVQGLLSQGQAANGQGTHGTAEPPATTASRGAGADSLANSGGTLPQAAAPDRLGASDRAKVEGLVSQGQAADGQGNSDQCLQALRDAQGVLQKARQ